MYESIDDLPMVCRINLPEGALKVYRETYNKHSAQGHAAAQSVAWLEVRKRYEREKETGRWIPKTTVLEPRVAALSGAIPGTIADASEEKKHSIR